MIKRCPDGPFIPALMTGPLTFQFLSCRRWDPATPMAMTPWALQVKTMPTDPGFPEVDWTSWMGPSAPATCTHSQKHVRGGWLCTRVQCKPQCFLRPDFIRCTARASPFAQDIWAEPQQQCPGSHHCPSPCCSPSAELSQDERHQMTADRVPRAGSRGFLCRHLAGCFKVFWL